MSSIIQKFKYVYIKFKRLLKHTKTIQLNKGIINHKDFRHEFNNTKVY